MAKIQVSDGGLGDMYVPNVHFPVGRKDKNLISDVQLVQVMLQLYSENEPIYDEDNARIYNIIVDGTFTAETERAIKGFQLTWNRDSGALRVVTDGRVSPLRGRLVSWEERGSQMVWTIYALTMALSGYYGADFVFSKVAMYPIEPLRSVMKEYTARPERV